ncbi:MAG: Acetyltransferase [Firmicutes bacterium]|nr:Acetyltransferase [Bacillota bacterium]
MYDLLLELPTIEHEVMANQFKKEFFDNDEQIIHGSALLDKMEYLEWLNNTQRNSNPLTVSKEWVVAKTFFAIRKSDKKIVGIIDIRHNLENQF